MASHTGRLVLSPSDPDAAPDPTQLRDGLTDAGLLGEPILSVPGAYRVGPQFLVLITFAGCAVHLETEATGDDARPFTHVRLTGPEPESRFRQGRNTRPPRCPRCRERLSDWRSRLQPGSPLACPACGMVAPACAWDWRTQAGCGRLFVDIEEVFPGEALPTPGLMDTLAAISGHPWRYFYQQDR
ncbi:hypothetical protein Thimo_0446 [Thioflavicoccus mobilis 8321]|uniref:Uncharacterized protein n=1 Tax=Thioflavicoccus mobilis 8321 TaxID=765912 RepID=L0GVB1_9GAMM|nr:hypothetical protein [Thioflavicoccus mobilis]AGA89305.1 hypothetical protein Thimo_0446 [Thioflavicoccus mobilis 8321]